METSLEFEWVGFMQGCRQQRHHYIKLFGKSDDQIDSLVQTAFTFSQDIGIEFGLKKCGMIILKVILNLLSLMEI